MSHFELSDHISIITGSAQGFGREFAERLLENGGKVCISDINEQLGQKTLQELQETFGKEKVTFYK